MLGLPWLMFPLSVWASFVNLYILESHLQMFVRASGYDVVLTPTPRISSNSIVRTYERQQRIR